MGFVRPELLLLVVPAGYLWWRVRDPSKPTQIARSIALALLLLALAAPYVELSEDGRDLVVVVDRSRSMPPTASDTADELIRLAEEARQPGDRVAVVGFGGDAAIETLPDASATFGGFQRTVDADASNLGEALDAALTLIPDGRKGSVLLVSDGEGNGRDPLAAARRAFARGIRIDTRPIARPAIADLSIERMDLPEEVAVGEPFQFSVWVHSDTRVETDFTLNRGRAQLSTGRRTFEPGLNRVLFRDVLHEGGVAQYSVEVELDDDRIPENNRGLGAVEAKATRALLVLNDDGAEDTLVRALRLAEIPVEVRAPESVGLDALSLYAWRGVILENVSAARIGSRGMDALAEWVVERGGGLMMTGGKGAFGVGGYHLTAIDEILPVSMELRQEHRKQGVALVLVLDRSGSMAAEVTPTTTKMDLANLGAAAAIELLSRIDSVGVIAVDSAEHVVQDLVPVNDPGALAAKVKTIRSSGGGIFCYTGLLAAGKMLEGAPHVNRHIVLFADAADAEEQGKVPELLAELRNMGTTVSVIALGTEGDSDAQFLKDTAEQGGGQVYFTNQPEELPRLFAQDTMMVARSTFLEDETTVELLPDLFGLGEVTGDGFPTLEGYNLNYLRDGAIAGAVTVDEYRAPIVSFWYRGLGRTAAYCGQIGGTFGQNITAWPEFSSFFVTLARWLAGQEEPAELFPTMRRDGSEAVIAVEVDPDSPVPPDTSNLAVRLRNPDGTYFEQLLERIDTNLYEARVELAGSGVTLGTLRLADGRFKNLPPIVLPYSPEFERAPDPDAGERLLRRLASETGGEVAPAAHTLFRGPRRTSAFRVISRELLLAGLLVFVVEVAARRLALWGALATLLSRLRRVRSVRVEPATVPAAKGPSAATRAAALRSESASEGKRERATPTRRKPAGSVTSALDAAKRKAGRKLDR